MAHKHKEEQTKEGTYAIFKSGGKQYRVEVGDIIDVELLDHKEGEPVKFKDVIFFCNGSDSKVGQPLIKGCEIAAEFVSEVKGPKITSVKYKRSHHQYRKFGHRQRYSRLKITGITA